MHIIQRHIFSFCALIVLGSLAFAGHAIAATVYVSNTPTNGYAAGSDAFTYTQAQNKAMPFLTVTGALNHVLSGDVIMINDGLYTESYSLIPYDDNLTITNDPETGMPGGVIVRVASGSRVFHAPYIAPGQGFAFGPIVLDAQHTQANVITADAQYDIQHLYFSGTQLLDPTYTWITSSHVQNLSMTDGWSAAADSVVGFGGFLVNGTSANTGTYLFDGGNVQLTNAGAGTHHVLNIPSSQPGLNVQFINNTVVMNGASASGTLRTVYIGADTVDATISGNTATFSGQALQARFIFILHKAVDLTAADNTITMSGNIATAAGIFGSGLATATIHDNAFDYTGATITTSSSAIGVANGPGITTACDIYNNSGDINATGVGIVVFVGDDGDPGTNAHHIVNPVVHNNTFSNTNHGYFFGYVTGGRMYRNRLDNAVIGVISKYGINTRFENNIVTRIGSGGALRDKGSVGAVFYNNTATLLPGGVGILTTHGATGATYANNIIWTDQLYPRFASVLPGSATLHHNLYYTTQSLPGNAWESGVNMYGNFASWQATGMDMQSVYADPLLVAPIGNVSLQEFSPAIDAGAAVALQNDYAGNALYGIPDIGAYEYQPLYSFAIDGVPTNNAVRVYADGQYRMVTSNPGSSAAFVVTPIGGWLHGTDQYMDIVIDSWLTSGTKNKRWTVVPSAEALMMYPSGTLYTVGDLVPNATYRLHVDGLASQDVAGYGATMCSNGTCRADGSGKMQFTYTGEHAAPHVFSLEQYVQARACRPAVCQHIQYSAI